MGYNCLIPRPDWLKRMKGTAHWSEVHKFHDDIVEQITEQHGSLD